MMLPSCVIMIIIIQVVDVAKMALRFERQQLLQYCVHFLVAHLGAVYVLHGKACLPSELQKKVRGDGAFRFGSAGVLFTVSVFYPSASFLLLCIYQVALVINIFFLLFYLFFLFFYGRKKTTRSR